MPPMTWKNEWAVKHKGEHDALVKQVLDVKGKFERGEPVMTMRMMSFLENWLVSHIQKKEKGAL